MTNPSQPRTSRRLAAITLATTLSLPTTNAVATDEPRYQVIGTTPEFESRRYRPYLVAETEVSGDFDEVGNQGFRILAGYIFGDNRRRAPAEMVAPAGSGSGPDQDSGKGEQIAMMAPVAQRPSTTSPHAYLVSFVMPPGYQLDTLPIPADQRIRLRWEPARLMAVRRYSGRWTRSRYQEEESALLRALEQAGLRPLGAPVYARYNPPFTPWFMRRNEVMVEVAEPGSATSATDRP